MEILEINEQIQIPPSELSFQYVKSSGPGGQNVNKVSTKAMLRWAVATSSSLPEEVRARFLKRHSRRINAAGDMVISCDRSRSQARNAESCLERLRELVLMVVAPPPIRRATRPSTGVKRRRLENKHRRSIKKKRRRHVSRDED